MKTQTTGLKRNNIEKFYTKPGIAKRFSNIYQKLVKIEKDELIIEPAAGTGVWSNQFSDYKLLSYDIAPAGENILCQNFLELDLTAGFHIPLHFIGNPPFGRQATLAKQFIKKICNYPKTKAIGFILPKSFKKDSFKKTFNTNYHLIYQEDIEDNAFLVNGEDYTVPCVFQIWKKETYKRTAPIIYNTKGYQFVKKEENPNYSLRRVGVYAGKIDKNIESKSAQSHYFIKLNKPINNFIEKYNSSVKFEHNNTVAAKSISKQEFIKEINNLF